MRTGRNELWRYCREVRSWLPCSKRIKRRILNQIREQGMQILEDNKEADYQTMCSFIGAPKQIAISYVEAMETSELLHDLRTKRKIERIIAGFAAVLIAIWTFAVGVAMANDFIQADGRIEVILNADTNN